MKFSNCRFIIARDVFFTIDDLELPDSGCITFVGANGSGKTSLARALSRELVLASGNASVDVGLDIARISFEKQLKIIDDDYKLRSSDNASEDELYGVTSRQLIESSARAAPEAVSALCQRLDIAKLLDLPYHVISSGEGRKVLIARAILADKNVIIMDAPFDGLDVKTRQDLKDIFYSYYESNRLVILIVNRYDEIPEFSDYVGIISERQVVKFGPRGRMMADLEFMQLQNNEALERVAPPPAPKDYDVIIPDGPLVEMEDVVVRYMDKIILNHLSMKVEKGQHWQITGPNGAGKSTLLALITGDHPQGYSNRLKLFGVQRGSGETIWDIKKNIGFVSPSFHLAYRVNCSVLKVILSGYFDSVGLYENPGDEKLLLARQWLHVVGLETMANAPFQSLSFGQQRIVLIARALVKHPPLLVLDEPLQGLDVMSRLLVKKFVEYLMKSGDTQILFVSHHREDAPEGITNILEFVPSGSVYTYRFSEAVRQNSQNDGQGRRS
ncbi:MAG: molybdate ABC transporter ATP-binding protein ModF [Succinivibrionaceae bacterium]|nr:molybdate ABC transporter ATP-binding protein ModF [Succinivibrionaceae bacterium]